MPLFVTCQIASIDNREKATTVRGLYVTPSLEYTCIDAKVLHKLEVSVRKQCTFKSSTGQEPIIRAVGYVILRVHGFETVDEVVFGEPGDLFMLGSRALGGFRAAAVRGKKRLISSGAVPAAPNRIEDWR